MNRSKYKRGRTVENQHKLLMNKLSPNYIDKLTQLLYEGKTTENYPLKRMNLDKAVYKVNKNKEFYITLPNFDFKNSSMTSEHNNYIINNKNISIQNFTENGSNLFTNDTNYNNSNSKNQVSEKSKRKINVDEYFGNKDEIKLNRIIKELLLNEDKKIMKYTKKLIFKQLNKKYNFTKIENKKLALPKTKLNIRSKDENINKNINFIFPKISNNNYIDYLSLLKRKTIELNSLKQKRYKNYLSPLLFIGKNKSTDLYNIKCIDYRKMSNNKIKDFKIRNDENEKYLKMMDNNINELYKINKQNYNF